MWRTLSFPHTPPSFIHNASWKMLYFRAVLSKLLYTFYSSENGLNYTLRAVFYVGFRNFRKTQY